MPRLLVCRECQSIEQLPLYDGPKELEAQDPILDNIVRRHIQKHGDINPEGAALLVASEDPCNCGEKTMVDLTGRVQARRPNRLGRHTFWEGHKDDILKGLRERWTGFHPEFYATKDTYAEDALRCYNLHRRPQGTDCIDWQADNRRLTPEGWKGKEVYLCHFCPVASTVVTEMRHKRGMYKKEAGETE
jgi:hypothetical protein